MTIYFDSAASYPVLPDVKACLNEAVESLFANPSSTHKLGEAAALLVEDAREAVADAIGALPSEIVFTSGATESNNLALKGHFSLPTYKNKRHLVISSIEHKCVHAIADFLKRTQGVETSVVKPNAEGLVTVEALAAAVQPNTSLVSVMHVNNELGTVNPISELGDYCFSKDIRFHTDAAQSFMKVDIDVDDMNIDYLSISGHKIGTVKGIGAVYIRDRRSMDFEPVVHGAGQEEGLRGGTLPAPLITCFRAAITSFPGAYAQIRANALKEYLIEELGAAAVPYRVNGASICSILSLTLPSTDVPALMRVTSNEYALATGSACSSKEIEASHVLTGIGLPRELAEATLRLSFHHELTRTDIDRLVQSIASYTTN
ncbi:MAG: cysteine desulfurase [Motiliproteus sp.]|nr:cysteine desulfurase [Motiliproteus sp.]MCW9053507.1 cysteine desulfurase [Motiliproteus sp.]